MTPQKQANKHDPENGMWGDCHRTAIAVALGLLRDAVPHFMDKGVTGAEAQRAEKAWLQEWCIVPITCAFAGDTDLDTTLGCIGQMNPGICFILGGQSGNGFNHSVVCCDGKIVCDPSQNDAGIVGPCDDGFYWVTFFGHARATA